MKIKELIQKLLDYEMDWEAKFDLLTSIGLDSTNEEFFRACEDIRNDLPDKQPLTDDIW